MWADATAWLVGRYVIMPDHIHLFAGLGELCGSARASPSHGEPVQGSPASTAVDFDGWVRYWKSQFTKRHGCRDHRWQAGHWDRRLRRSESYGNKWDYVRHNPVRHGLVDRPEGWPFQGELNDLPWL